MKVNKWFGLVCIAAIMSSCAVSSDEKKENNGYENDVIKTIMERRSIRKNRFPVISCKRWSNAELMLPMP